MRLPKALIKMEENAMALIQESQLKEFPKFL